MVSSNGTSVEEKIGKRITNQRVTFTAYLDHVTTHIGIGQTIVFNKVITNDGNAYNKHISVFTAPVTGTHFFTFTIHLYRKGMNVKLVTDGTNLVGVVAHSGSHLTPDANDFSSAKTTNCVVIQLDAGQAVCAQVYHDADLITDMSLLVDFCCTRLMKIIY